MASRGYGELIAWQKAMELVETVYTLTRTFPDDERFGLTSQLRRAAVSVPSNIAEGHGRTSTNEYLHHLSIARGSLCEVETQLLIGERLGYLDRHQRETVLSLAGEIGRLIHGLIKALSGR
jgi:four helix bundle protein